MAVGGGLLDAVEIGAHDQFVALDREDQGDVDADALGERADDGRQALLGGGDLDQQVGSIDGLPQVAGLGDGGVGVSGQGRIDLE